MGFVLWRTNTAATAVDGQTFSMKRQIIFAASVSLLNPHAILDTIGVIGTNSLTYSGNVRMGLHANNNSRFLALVFRTSMGGRYFGKIDSSGKLIALLNKVSALVVWGVAVYMAIRLAGNMG